MDPGAMMNEGSFANGIANTVPFNLAEIWQFPMSGGACLGESGGGLGLKRPQFGHNLGQLSDFVGPNRDVPDNDPVSSEQRAYHDVNNKKRGNAEEESPNGVSTSNGCNGVNNGDGKRLKTSGSKNESRDTKAHAEPSSGKPVEQSTQPPAEPPKQDYIHVRARRGQATDSHSLAESYT